MHACGRESKAGGSPTPPMQEARKHTHTERERDRERDKDRDRGRDRERESDRERSPCVVLRLKKPQGDAASVGIRLKTTKPTLVRLWYYCMHAETATHHVTRP